MTNSLDLQQQPKAALEVTNLTKRYGSTVAVDNLSFQLQHGQLLAFLGPNGAGKTTTIEICEGFNKPSSGTVRVLGLDPQTQAEAVRSRIGIMLQGGGSYSGIRVGEMMHLAAAYNRNPLDPEWLLKVLGLKPHEKTTYRRLSGGQQQRLSLALALISRPELVFLDEPTAGMDTQSRLLVWQLIQHLKEDGVSVVLTTHLMDEAQALADQVIIIDRGKKVAAGTVAELRSGLGRGQQAANNRLVLRFHTNTDLDLDQLHRFPELHGFRVSALKPLSYALGAQEHTHPEITPQVVAALTAAVAQQQVLITSLSTNLPSLEDIFLEITGRSLRSS